MKRKIVTLNRLLFGLIVSIYLVSLWTFGYLDYTYNKKQIMQSLDEELYNIAITIKYLLPDDYHDRSVDYSSVSIEEDKTLSQKLTDVVRSTDIKFIYTLIKRENKLFFTASDLVADPETKRGTYYFNEYTDADRSFFDAFDKKTPTYKTVSDKWGIVRTVMIPQQSPGGVTYLACADYDIGYINDILFKRLLRSIIAVLFFTILLLPVFNSYNRMRRKYISSLRSSEKKYKSLTNNLTVGVYRVVPGANRKIIEANPAMAEMFGFDSRESFLKEMGRDAEKGSLFNRDELIHSLTKNGSINNAEFRLHKKDGKPFVASVSAVTVKSKNGDVKYYDGVIEDITAQKRSESALRESEENLARAERMESLGVLAGGVAHDLNNVLSGIVGYPELILMDLPEESEFREYVEAIRDSGKRSADIVQDLLTVASDVANTKEPIHLNKFIADYLVSPEFLHLKNNHPAVDVETRLDPRLYNFSGSPVHIQKVLMNLVLNASDAVNESGIITISTQNRYLDKPLRRYNEVVHGDYVVLSVSDNGSGISENDLERIFEPFYTKKVMDRRGTGLGLTVVWNAVRDHNGYIEVTSGKSGTIFSLYFPRTDLPLPEKPSSVPLEEYLGKGETILVVDDVESQRRIACRMLQRLQYNPLPVSSGEEAVEYLTGHTVDMVLLDMIMSPGINGCETYKRIIEIHPGQKAVIVSGFAETDDVTVCVRLGVGTFVKKPFSLDTIGLAIKAVLNG